MRPLLACALALSLAAPAVRADEEPASAAIVPVPEAPGDTGMVRLYRIGQERLALGMAVLAAGLAVAANGGVYLAMERSDGDALRACSLGGGDCSAFDSQHKHDLVVGATTFAFGLGALLGGTALTVLGARMMRFAQSRGAMISLAPTPLRAGATASIAFTF
jgi:hypothetical protein